MKEGVIVTMSKGIFCKGIQNKCDYKMDNNGHSAKVKLWLWQISWVHIHAKFEDLVNTSVGY